MSDSMPILRQWSFYAGLLVPAALAYVVLFTTLVLRFQFRTCVAGFLVVCFGLVAALWKRRRTFAVGVLVGTPITVLAAAVFLVWAFGHNIVS